MARGRGVDHVSLHGREIACFHCGAREIVIHDDQRGGIGINSPAWAGFVAHGEAFERLHGKCKETAASPTKRLEGSAFEWERGLFVGSSSATIFAAFVGRPPVGVERDRIGALPQDPADFNRCHRLLQVEPSWRENLQAVAVKHPAWGPMVAAWDELTQMLVTLAPGMYDRMQALIKEGGRG